MKIAEIREIATNELAERIEAEVANYNQMVLNHSISPLDNPAQIKKLRRTIARMKAELHTDRSKSFLRPRILPTLTLIG